ncbi:MAG: hypothetical protein Q7K57_48685 [Burkholderiaceae bacterium]|nr:hypothetical protein [Burkholderiaceae bacterium]
MTDAEAQPQLGKTFKEDAQGYSWSGLFDFGRLQSGQSVITERLDGRNVLCDALWNYCFPTMTPGVYSHHTSLHEFSKIIRTEEVLLQPVSNQLSTGEMTIFAKKFDFDGYLHQDADGGRLIESLAKDLFALSLSGSAPTSVHWNRFGPVRMLLDVRPVLRRAELRRVEYADPTSPAVHPLTVLDSIAKERFGKRFIAWRTSRMGAFYLSFLFDDEDEVRLLIKREEGVAGLPIKASPSGEVLAIPLNSDYDRVNISLVGVQTQSAELVDQVSKVLATVPHWNVQVGVYPE